jgi:hypothetical protein
MPCGFWSSGSLALCFRTLTFLWFTCVTRPAQAGERVFVELDYRTDAALSGCPSDTSFKLMVQNQLGYDPFRADSAHTVVARAYPDGDGIKGLVEWRDAAGARRGERELSTERVDCTEFARVMSFTIAVQIQLLAESIEQKAAGGSTPAEAEPSDTTPKAAPLVPPVSRRRGEADTPAVPATTSGEEARWQFMLGGGPALSFGFTPRAAFGGRVFARVRRSQLALELGAEASLPARHTLSDSKGFHQHFIAGSVAGCASLGSLSGCIVNKWGTLQVRGFGVDVPREASGLVGLAGLRLMFNEHLAARWVGGLRVEGLATLAPWRVTLNQRRIWVTPTLSLCLGADLGAVF